MKIEVLPYNPYWKMEFVQLQHRIREILNYPDLKLEHVGSTSVPGLAAKPIIDIAVGIPSSISLDDVVDPMIQAGFIYYEAFNTSMPQRRLFVGLKDSHHLKNFPKRFSREDAIPHEEINLLRHCHIHIWVADSQDWKRHLAFRDYLIKHPDVVKAYSKLKLKLALREWKNGMEYNAAKDAFIKEHENYALAQLEAN